MARLLRLNDLATDVYPASWYAVAPGRQLPRGGILEVDVCGRTLVLFRTRSGELGAMDRYCPHMGASLACGKVVGERIVCPFHAWEFSTSGDCATIPYLKEGARIPPTARIPTVPVLEHLGWVWVYHGEKPSHGLPDVPEMRDPSWGVIHKSQLFETHALHTVENGTDAEHFRYIHKVDFVKYEVDVFAREPHRLAFHLDQELHDGTKLRTTIDYAGASTIFGSLYQNGKLQVRFIAAPLPQGPKLTLFHLIVATPKLPVPLRPLDGLLRRYVAKRLFNGATDDYLPVWKKMNPERRRVLVAEDRLQQEFRRYWLAHIEGVNSAVAEVEEVDEMDVVPRRQTGT
ncbi:Rieske 2Fe-2S domain-containing protein [Cystobacter fuscus]|uniref:Rieske 2Fe-2S domain-containing protein n=1 Tax=Cystobacter fuscus TaxID=43 RepID=UPI002B30836E|nr:Rieske (2Fe-2S) protein [Cystobacter fuscus]